LLTGLFVVIYKQLTLINHCGGLATIRKVLVGSKY